jgi:hypothetical protein
MDTIGSAILAASVPHLRWQFDVFANEQYQYLGKPAYIHQSAMLSEKLPTKNCSG